MLTFLLKRFVKIDMDSPEARLACGTIASLLGVALNLLLFAGKLLAGSLSGSLAVTTDAFNNLSDAGSSLTTLLGFRLAEKKADTAHPFGHGRMEYVSGLIVAMIILLMGAELLKSSLERIIAPTDVEFSLLTVGILAASIGVKAYMCLYNRALGRRIHSAAMRASATDSLSDAVATSAVLCAMLVDRLTGLRLDGWAGLAVSAFILYAGFSAARDTINPLLGTAPDPALVEKIRREALRNDHVLGIHDLMIHDYGPGRRIISFHAEVPADGDLLAMHDAIDHIEQTLKRELKCEAVIHMDPVVTDDRVALLKREVADCLRRQIDPSLDIHDFRIVDGPTQTTLVFDALAPFDLKLSDDELRRKIGEAVGALDAKYRAVVNIDRG